MTYSSDADWVAAYVAGDFDDVDDDNTDGDQGWSDTATVDPAPGGWTDERLLNLGYKPRVY